MTDEDLTITDVLKDPMIRLMMRADGISVRAVKVLLLDASRREEVRFSVVSTLGKAIGSMIFHLAHRRHLRL